MPPAIVFAVNYLAVAGAISVATAVAIGTFVLTYGTAILVVGGLAYSAAKRREGEARARDAYNAAQVDRLANVSSAVAPRDLVLGRVRKAGAIFYKGSTGRDQQDMYLAIALAGHEIDAIEAIYLNDELVTLDGSGNVTDAPYAVSSRATAQQVVGVSGTITLPADYIVGSVYFFDVAYDTSGQPSVSGLTVTAPEGSVVNYQVPSASSSKVKITKYLGAAGQTADPSLLAAFPADWSSANVVQGVAYLVVKLSYSETAFPNGIPAVTAIVRGAKLYDPRSGLTVWSENPALMMRHVYQHPKFGKATVSASEDTRFIAAANACDTATIYTVAGVAQPSRALYKAAMVQPFGAPARSALDDLAQAMGGSWAFAGGELYVKAGVYTSSVMSLTDADLAVITRSGGQETQVPITISVHRERAQKFNTVKAKIWDVQQDYKEAALTPLAPSAFVTADGVELVQEVPMPAIGYAPQALHIAGVMLRDARDPLTVELPFKLRAYPLELFDTVDLTISRYGWAAKTFMVIGRVWTAEGSISLTLKETTASVFTLDGSFSAQGFAANTNLPSPWLVATLGTLTVTSGTNELIKQADGTVVSRMRVSWPQIADAAVVQAGRIEVQYRLASSSGEWTTVSTDGANTEIVTADVQDGGVYIIRARGRTTLGVGDWCVQVLHQVVGKTQPPSDVTSITYATEQFGIRLKWPAIADADADFYEVRVGGASWGGATLLTQTRDAEYLWKTQTAGTYTVWVKAIDSSGNISANAVSTSVIVTVPVGPTVTWAVSGPNEVLSWTIPASLFQIDRFEIRYGATWAGGAFVDTTKQTGYTRKGDYLGTRVYWVAAVDSAGNYGTPSSVTAAINAPSAITSGRADIVDNNALIYWTVPALSLGQLQVDRYEVRKGATYAGGTVVGSNGNSTFASVFEQAAGTYTYWIAAIDTAGNTGTAVSISATINQPPDYILRNDYNSVFPGTLTNLYVEAGKIIGPIDTAQTFGSHFTSNGWATPQDQINAGFPIYATPSTTSGSYEEIIDYGASIPSTVVTATLNSTVIVGTVSVTCTLSWKLLAGDPWTVLTAGTSSALIPEFRYVRVRYDFACTAGSNLIQLNALNIKLATKLRNDSGTGTVTVAGSGCVVTFGYPFVAADTPIVQPNGSTPLIPVVVYAGGPNPTTFTVYLYTTAGAQTTGSFSWNARGF